MGRTESVRVKHYKFKGLLTLSIIAVLPVESADAPFSETAGTKNGDSRQSDSSDVLAPEQNESLSEFSTAEGTIAAEVSRGNMRTRGSLTSQNEHFDCSAANQPQPKMHQYLEGDSQEAGDNGRLLPCSPSLSDCGGAPQSALVPKEDASSYINEDSKEGFSPRLSRPRSRWRSLWSRLRGWFSRGGYPASIQTPFNLNRCVLLLTYVISTVLTAGTFFGWRSMSSIIFRQEAYSSVCPQYTNGTLVEDMREQGREFICNEQDVRVQQLFSLGWSLHCVIAVLGGFLYGRVGPRNAALLGHVTNFVGWLLLGASSPSFEAQAAAVALIASASPLCGFPPYCVRGLFPGREHAIMMVLGAAMSAGVGIPRIIDIVSETVGIPITVGGFALLGLVPSFLVALFLIPHRDFSEFVCGAAEGYQVGRRKGQIAALQQADAELGPPFPSHPAGLRRIWSRLCGAIVSSGIFSRFFAILTVYRTVAVMLSGYYLQASGRMLHPSGNSALPNILISSPAFCLLFGLAGNCCAPLFLMAAASVTGLLSFVLPLLSSSALASYFSSISFSCYLGLALPQSLAFLEATVGEARFPPIAGMLVMISGLLGSVSAPLYGDVTVGIFEGNFRPLQIVCIILLSLQFLWLYLLHRQGAAPLREVAPTQMALVLPDETPPQETAVAKNHNYTQDAAE